MTDTVSKVGFWGSIVALLTAACCVLPMTMLLLGLGGSWIAVFGQIALYSTYVGIAAVALLASAWILALRRKAKRPTYVILAIGSAFSVLAWAIYLNESSINDYLITLM